MIGPWGMNPMHPMTPPPEIPVVLGLPTGYQRDTTIRCGEEQLWNAVLVNGGDEEVLFSIQLGPSGPTAVPMEAANM